MFNLSGSEIIVILLLALVVLGPEKLPDALRRAGKTYAELKKMGSTFQEEVKGALDEPMKEMRETADLLRKSAEFEDRPAAPPAEKAPSPRPARPTTRQATAAIAPISTEPVAADVSPPANGDVPTTDDGRNGQDLINRTLSGGANVAPVGDGVTADGGAAAAPTDGAPDAPTADEATTA